ncbi:MAG TPA: hypothetical protein VKA08_04125 [Balneolales bacterium]|nr:hypothetical protein [Balneolales bacterium]
MTTLSARMAMLLLAFGLFVSCSTTKKVDRNGDSANDQSIQKALSNKNYQTALKDADKAIQRNPKDPNLYYLKGKILSEMAVAITQPDQQQPLYKNMRQNLLEAQQLDKQGNGPLEPKIDDLLANSWSDEHNQGVSILSHDSTDTRTDLNNAKVHLQNATIIMPDSAISHAALATVYYKLGEIPEALGSMEMAVSYDDSVHTDYLERLAYLYSVNEQDSEAVNTYRLLIERNPGDLNLLNGLMNVYLDERSYGSVEGILQTMLEKDPDNPLYHQIYGRELYNASMAKLLAIRNGYEDVHSTGQNELNVSDSLNSIEGQARTVLDSAINQFDKAISLDSTDTNASYTLGIIYQNSGVSYLQIAQQIQNSELSAFYKARAQQLLTKALPYLVNYTSKKSSDRKSWENLREVYQYLGMNDKAQQAAEHLSQQ